jgi:hypothetical protein
VHVRKPRHVKRWTLMSRVNDFLIGMAQMQFWVTREGLVFA